MMLKHQRVKIPHRHIIFKMTSPTARSLAYLRKEGYLAQVVEKFNMFSKTRIDLFGCIDIVAVRSDVMGMLGIQVTVRSNIQDRVKKCKAELKMRTWLSADNRLEVHGWGLMGKQGKRKKYELKVVEIKNV